MTAARGISIIVVSGVFILQIAAIFSSLTPFSAPVQALRFSSKVFKSSSRLGGLKAVDYFGSSRNSS